MKVIILVLVSMFLTAPAMAQGSVNLAWEPTTTDVGSSMTASVAFPVPGVFYVRVIAYNEVGVGEPSNEVVATIPGPSPPPPPPPPVDVCETEPFIPVVSVWPDKKRAAVYSGSHEIANVTWMVGKGNRIYGATFTDIRGCIEPVLKP
jgi:hypothetical protein